jgi:ribonuclease PH
MTKEEQKKLLKLAIQQHEQLINLLTQILIEVRNK